jgi:ribonuclease R
MMSRDQVLQMVRDKVQHPASVWELVQVLKVPREERATFRRHLKGLAADGLLIQVLGSRYGLPEKMDLVVGRLETHTGGFTSSCRSDLRRTSRISTLRRRT